MKTNNIISISLYYVKKYHSYYSFLVCENAFLRRKLLLLLLLLLLFSYNNLINPPYNVPYNPPYFYYTTRILVYVFWNSVI